MITGQLRQDKTFDIHTMAAESETSLLLTDQVTRFSFRDESNNLIQYQRSTPSDARRAVTKPLNVLTLDSTGRLIGGENVTVTDTEVAFSLPGVGVLKKTLNKDPRDLVMGDRLRGCSVTDDLGGGLASKSHFGKGVGRSLVDVHWCDVGLTDNYEVRTFQHGNHLRRMAKLPVLM